MAEQRVREPDLTSVRLIVYTMLFTLLLVLGSGWLLWLAYLYWRPQPSPPQFAQQPVPPGQVRLQENPRADMHEYRKRIQQRLHSTGWLDRHAGVVHIPIEQAMALLVERGLPKEAEQQPEQNSTQKNAIEDPQPQGKAAEQKSRQERSR